VHALTDITGFGLAGHTLEIARGAKCVVQIDWARVPLIDGVHALASAGMVTGASGRNWAGYGHEIALPEGFSAVDQALLSDPQTSGGLLVSCAPEAVAAVLEIFARHGFADAADIGCVLPADASPEGPKLRVSGLMVSGD
jgi:selenide,water dikinase